MFKLLFIILILLVSNPDSLTAQTTEESFVNDQYGYFFTGTNLIISSYSFNYEKRISKNLNRKSHIYARVGAGASVLLWAGGNGVLGGFSFVRGNKKNRSVFSMGAFGTYHDHLEILPMLELGRRIQYDNDLIFGYTFGTLGLGFSVGKAF